MRFRARWFVIVAAVSAIGVSLCWRGVLMGSKNRVGDGRSSTLPQIVARPYAYRAPRSIDPSKLYPLVIGLHGLGGHGSGFEHYFDLDRLVDEMGFLGAFPDGSEEKRPSNPRRFWNATDRCCDFYGSGVDDVAYIDDIISDMSTRFRVDPKRVYLVGHSNGAYMAYRFACDRASRVAAIVSSAGAMWNDVSRCQPSEPVAVLELHGTADEVVPYAGGALDGIEGAVKPVHATVSDWIAFDHCATSADISAPHIDLVADEEPAIGAETSVERWGDCRGVELWTIRGGRHSPEFHQPELASTLGAWLLAHPKP
jgi:polyhydroxybutyrate depolymerase